jgi:hypothetical protein
MTQTEVNIFKEVIERYVEGHPDQWAAWLREQKQRRDGLIDPEFGSLSTEQAMRWTLCIPEPLYIRLKAAAMRFFEKDLDSDRKKFIRDMALHFPIFKISEKI